MCVGGGDSNLRVVRNLLLLKEKFKFGAEGSLTYMRDTDSLSDLVTKAYYELPKKQSKISVSF